MNEGKQLMKNLEFVLRDYIIGRPVISIEYDDEEQTAGEIIDAHRELVYGHIELNDEQKLTSFVVDMDEIMNNNDVSLDEYEELTLEELIGCAEDFAKDFCRESLHLRKMTEWNGESYMVVFEEKDATLDLFIPNSGVTIEINKQGFIISAVLFQSYYQLVYPDIQISAEEAKEIISQYPLVQLGIFEDSGEMKLVYYPNREYLAVHVDGQVATAEEFLEEGIAGAHEFKSVEVTQSLESLLGVTNNMYKKITENGTFWYMSEDDDNVETAEPIIRMERTDDFQLDFESNIEWEESEELSKDSMEERAKMFLELIVGNIHEKYILEDQLQEDDDIEFLNEENLTEEERQFFEELEKMEEDEEDGFEEDDDFNFEPFMTFTFIRQYKGLRMEEYSIHVNVGIYTGVVRDCSIILPDESQLLAMNMEPVVSVEVAKTIFKDHLQMKLARTVNYEDEDEDITLYGLDYVMDFPQHGRIERIDATTGEVYYEFSDILREG